MGRMPDLQSKVWLSIIKAVLRYSVLRGKKILWGIAQSQLPHTPQQRSPTKTTSCNLWVSQPGVVWQTQDTGNFRSPWGPPGLVIPGKDFMDSVLVFCYCCNKWLQTQCLETPCIHFWRSGVLTPRCWQGCVPSWASRGESVSLPSPAFGSFLHSLAHGLFPPSSKPVMSRLKIVSSPSAPSSHLLHLFRFSCLPLRRTFVITMGPATQPRVISPSQDS